MKTRGKLSAENPHAGFDVAGAGNVLCFYRGAPDLDPTDEGELEIEPIGHYASSLLYWSKRPDISSLFAISQHIVPIGKTSSKKIPKDVLFEMYSSDSGQPFMDELFYANRTLPRETYRELLRGFFSEKKGQFSVGIYIQKYDMRLAIK